MRTSTVYQPSILKKSSKIKHDFANKEENEPLIVNTWLKSL